MRFRRSLSWVCLVVGLMACDWGRAVAAPPKIYIVTDLEGASGVYKLSQVNTKETLLGQKAMEYLMGDIAAVVRGLRDGGAGEILVLDGHGLQALVPHLMEPAPSTSPPSRARSTPATRPDLAYGAWTGAIPGLCSWASTP